ncbi:TRAP transporter small permease [Pelagibacterium halotolerans]|uniref:TRAP transporter small permease n=1 Tax=Pelagibacterium halotolerans TaxID=531813 RepID=UPI00384D67FA
MSNVIRFLRWLSEAVAALFMLLMFATFIVQVAIRYGARLDGLTAALPFLDPNLYGWTLEFCLALWVWLIFWGNSFIVRAADHVSFDIIAESVPRPVARVFLVITGLAIGIGLLASIVPTWERFAILRIKQTATLGDLFGDWIRMRDVYAIYILFLVVVGLRALWAAAQAIWGKRSPLLAQTDEGQSE